MLNNIIASVIGGLVVATVAAIWVWLYRRHLLARVQGIRQIYGDTLATYENAREAIQDIEREAVLSKHIRYIGDYNTTFLAERYPQETLLYRILEQRKIKKQQEILVQFLHLSPSSDFLEIRARELNYPAKDIRDGLLTAFNNVRTTLSMLNLPKELVQVRHYDFQVIFRVILLDRCAFIGFYKVGRMGGFSPVVKVSRDSEFYQAISRYFDVLWNHLSHPAEEDTVQTEEKESETPTSR